MTTNNLTEQWKKGELESGLFYVKMKNNDKPIVAEYDKETCFYTFRSIFRELNRGDIEEVLAPVPSWEEYLESESHCAVYSEVNQVLKKKNQQLKELLTDICCELVDDEEDMTNGLLQYFNTEVIDRIKEALK